MYKWALVILLMLISSVEAGELPSQVDLRAAYCIPIAQHFISEMTSFEKNEHPPELKAELGRIVSEMNMDLRRLQSRHNKQRWKRHK